MEKERTQQQQINFTHLPKYQSLTDLEKQKFQLFITSLIKIKRDSLRVIKSNPEVKQTELPHYLLNSSISFFFSVNTNSWMIEKNFKSSKFNPNIVTGVSLFLKDIELDDIKTASNLLENDTEILFKTYGINVG